ncbi:hypothetical protein HPB50_012301 [Hyalomma asiaticum]|uniref:Uncharacterized protein n=1 Tax=Hyalomma asiaticum TaxID=266040 RepID=A0ACB7RU65_HYAAI|nr:hypothetical protein HPB50_012301 [Hyalomma asiaticum]
MGLSGSHDSGSSHRVLASTPHVPPGPGGTTGRRSAPRQPQDSSGPHLAASRMSVNKAEAALPIPSYTILSLSTAAPSAHYYVE